MKRRSFITQVGLGLGLGSLANAQALSAKEFNHLPKLALPPKSEIDPKDEKYWGIIREHFPLTKDRIYLNNGGLGPSPYVSIEKMNAMTMKQERLSEGGHSAKLWQTIKTSSKVFIYKVS